MAYVARRTTRTPRRRNVHGLGFMAAGVAAGAAGAGPVGWVVAGVATLVQVIAMIFGAHAAAVAREANTLNAAVPVFVQGLQAVFAAANAGQISQAQALSFVDQAVALYYQQVGAIIKKSGPCNVPSNCVWPGGALVGNTNLDPCNGPCSVGCGFIEPAACMARTLLNAGTGTGTTKGLAAHAGWTGVADLTLSASLPVSAGSASSTLSNLPTWAILSAVGLIGIFAIGSRQ